VDGDSQKPPKTETRHQSISQEIKKIIFDGTMRPGDRLPPERELSSTFAASRIAIREALKSLEASGLVVIKPGSGVFVTNVSSKTMSDSLYSILKMQNTSISEVTEARLIVEPNIARIAAERATEADFQRLEMNIREAQRVIDENIPPTTQNIEFHSILAEMSHNTVINLVMKSLHDVLDAMFRDVSHNVPRRLRVAAKSLNQHKRILKALRERNPDKAYRLMFDHIVEIQGGLTEATTKLR
jgi:GntR family transcriptional regulator, transcriptional repressor for pyruvate dehydrogenase complex